MRIEMKDVDPRDASDFIQRIIDELEITATQAGVLKRVVWEYDLKVNIWKDESGCHNASPNY